MKKNLNHPAPETNPRIWRSLRERENDPEFLKHLQTEFPRGADVYQDSGLSKREFMKLMGASIALAGVGLAGCRRPESYLVPFTKGVEFAIPGKFLYYATSMPARYGAVPLIATTADGRPTKLEGNPLHPFSNGGTDSFAQAEILNLYDPHRSKQITENGKASDSAAFDAFIQSLVSAKAEGLAILSESKNSPTRDRLRAALEAKFPNVLWAEYDPLAATATTEANEAAFGPNTRLVPQFTNADVVLAIGSDFLNPIETGIGFAQGFAARRSPEQDGKSMNRLYAVENHFTVTGGMADHRLRCKASELGEFTRQLALALAGLTNDANLAAVAKAFPASNVDLNADWVKECAADLAANKGRSIVLAGPLTPAPLQTLVNAINNALGNIGATLIPVKTDAAVPTVGRTIGSVAASAAYDGTLTGALALTKSGTGTLTLSGNKTYTGGTTISAVDAASIADLAAAINKGSVKNLFLLGVNPVQNAPADLDFAALLAKVPNTVHLGLFEDETAKACRWHVPSAHFLESWGDIRTFDGTYTSVQPMILPLWNGVSEIELLNKLTGAAAPEGPALVRATFNKIAKDASDDSWNAFLRDGFLPDSDFPTAKVSFNAASAAALAKQAQPAKADALELVFLQSSSVDDGRYANNSWLLETPDFVTKLTWDNAVLVSPATAKKLGIKANNFNVLGDIAEKMGNDVNYDLVADIVEISDGKKTIEAAAIVAPGHADDSLSIALGYGRKGVSALMDGVGFDAYPLRTTGSMLFLSGVTLKVTNRDYPMAQTQEHRSMEGRDLVREGTFERYEKDNTFAQKMGMDSHIPPNISLYTHPELTSKEQWGMTVDLNTCTGCNACVVACQAENNVPVVGKDQVRKNRDMAWIRLDRYFAGDADEPEMLSQAVMCQHCENAPCETVCPVNATVHSEDGLNLMAYNRCIGTRYCANNCPWKVRRFNYFDYNQRPIDELYWGPLAKKGMADSLKMAKNPNVTVRMRGVMEKCTFCIQRIEEAKISRLVEAGASAKSDTPIASFKVACQQACPNDSLVFGDIANPKSAVSISRKDPRRYEMFKYLNVTPRVLYLARIKNPNPKMPGADQVGMANGSGHHGEDHGADHGSHNAQPPHGATHAPAGH